MSRDQVGGVQARTTPLMRFVFILGAIFVALAGFQLYVLAADTDRFFAWTIGVPLTAAFLGAYYWTALVVSLLSWRERQWANARVGVVGVFAFLLLTLSTTFINLDQFHLDKGPTTARLAAWAWLIIYILDPILVAAALFAQRRARGPDPPRVRPFSISYRVAIGASAIVSTGVGVALYVAPRAVADALWPWPLTPLTARAVAAWLVGAGIILAVVARENDHRRTRPAAFAYGMLGLLQIGALVRYSGTVDWAAASTWLYVAFFVAAVVVGTVGAVESQRAMRDVA